MTQFGRRRPELGHVHDSRERSTAAFRAGGWSSPSAPPRRRWVRRNEGADIDIDRVLGLWAEHRRDHRTPRIGPRCMHRGLGAGAYAGSATEVLSSAGRAARTHGQVINAQTPATTAISTTT